MGKIDEIKKTTLNFGYVAFYYQFWMYVYKYEFEENKGIL